MITLPFVFSFIKILAACQKCSSNIDIHDPSKAINWIFHSRNFLLDASACNYAMQLRARYLALLCNFRAALLSSCGATTSYTPQELSRVHLEFGVMGYSYGKSSVGAQTPQLSVGQVFRLPKEAVLGTVSAFRKASWNLPACPCHFNPLLPNMIMPNASPRYPA
jgi:hypothetical protein